MNLSLETVDAKFLREHDYGIKFGNYDMPHYKECTDPVILFIKANQAELRRRLKEMKEMEARTIQAKDFHSGIANPTIQIWEPCQRCGREPSYITLRGHLCRDCIDR